MNNYQLSVKSYPVYKDSGVEWLGDVPEHWEVKKFNHIAYIVEGQINPKEDPYKNYILIAPNHIEAGTARLLYQETASEQGAESGKYLFRANDIIYSKIRPALKKVWKANFLGICSADMYPIRLLKEKIEPNYFTFLCLSESFSNFMIATSIRVAMPKVNRNDFHECHFAIPSFSEQKLIATYLDTKTAQCDRKIDLLTQKATQYGKLKQSLINETVTHGLDKSVPMKDSGVEWISRIPKHWEIKRIKDIGLVVLGKMLDSTGSDDKFYRYYLKSKNIGWLNVDTCNVEQMYFSSAEMKYCRIKRNDLLLSEGGEVGKTSIWKEEIDECYIQNSVQKITLHKENYSRYFLYQSFLLGNIKYYDSIVNHVSIKHLTKEKLSRVVWVCPPLSEQKAIADYLDTKTAQIDQIIQTINTQIEKLKELRKTLINDVVTGKIKVIE